MQTFQFEDIMVSPECRGAREYAKVSYPIRYGRYGQIETKDYIFQFNPSGEIKFIQGRSADWPANEWLKRTAADDWVYYSAEGYNSVHSLVGEYYLPCFSYSKNPLAVANPFNSSPVKNALESLEPLAGRIGSLIEHSLPLPVRDFLSTARLNTRQYLAGRARVFHAITGTPVSVLPPDTRHVDYDVIPIIIADGCVYNCGFCSVKSGKGFAKRHRESIIGQINGMRNFFGPDMCNFNSIFLGQHDALQAGAGSIEFAALTACEIFRLENSSMKGANLFIFGSVGSLLTADEKLFIALNEMPYRTFINIGLESADQETLDILNKPVTADKVRDAFSRMNYINLRYEHIEVSANFILGATLPEKHVESIIDLASRCIGNTGKGAVYISPLDEGVEVRQVRKEIYRIKNNTRVPVFMYLIQRL